MGHRLQQFLPFTQPRLPHLFRHQMLTYLTSKGLTDAQIQSDFRPRKQKEPRGLPTPVTRIGDKAYQDAVQSVGI